MRPSEPSAPRVVLDTQVLLRGAVAKTESLTAKIYDAWRGGRFTLLLSDAILAEIEDVLGRPEVLEKLRLSPIEARGLITLGYRVDTRSTTACASTSDILASDRGFRISSS